MKRYLLLFGLLTLLLPLSAETLTICQTFEKLLTNVANFKPLMGEQDPKNIMATLSTFQVEGAESSSFIQSLNKVTFEAKLGSYPTNQDAFKKQNELMKAMRVCYPTMEFVIRNEQVMDVQYMRSYPFIKNKTSLNVYEASFCIKEESSMFTLSFEFPQAKAASALSKGTPAFTNYIFLDEEFIDSPFADSLYTLFDYAPKNFEPITGSLLLNEVDKKALRYDVSYKLPSCPDSYVEQNTNNERSYVIRLCNNVDEVTFGEKVNMPIVKRILVSLGKSYAYKASANGQTMDFVRTNDPLNKLISFDYSVSNGKYTACFIIYSTK